VSKRNIPKLEEYTSYIKTIFHHDDSITENSENEPLPANFTKSEEIAQPTFEGKAPIIEETVPIIEETAPVIDEKAPIFEETAPILNNEEVVSAASKLGDDKIVDEMPSEQTI